MRANDLLNRKIEEHTVRYFIYEKWLPSAVGFIMGSIILSIAIPQVQAKLAKADELIKRKQSLAETIVTESSAYIIEWGRLIKISQYENQLPTDKNIDESTTKRKESYINRRDEARLRLYSNIEIAKLYFSNKTIDVLDKFVEWDTEQGNKTIDALPEINDWKSRRSAVVVQLLKEATQ